MQASRKSLLKTYKFMKGGEKVPGSQARLEIIYKTKEHLYNHFKNKLNPLLDNVYQAEEHPLPFLICEFKFF